MKINEIRVGRLYRTAMGRSFKVLQIKGTGDAQVVRYRGNSHNGHGNGEMPLRKFADMLEEMLPDPKDAVLRKPGGGIKS